MSTQHTSEIPLGERLLAAVVFTDVAGFSRLVGCDESKALQSVRRDFQLMAPLITRYHGRLLKTMGDGQLIFFHCATNAVDCAVAMQLALSEAALSLPSDEVLQHRIGIHLGDVFIYENDVHGNGVNIAARLQGHAEPGGICISQTVYDVVKHQLAMKVNYLGAQELKNITESIHLYHLLVETAQQGTATAMGPPPGSGMTLQTSLAATVTPLLRQRIPEAAFHLVMLGDFSGRSSRGLAEPWSNRQPLAIDSDNLDAVLARTQVWLPMLQQPGGKLVLQFKTLDDFHPDQICRQVEPLNRLVQLRKRLLNSKTSAAAILEMQELFGSTVAAAPPPPAATDSALVELLFRQSRISLPPNRSNPATAIDALIKNLVSSSGLVTCQSVPVELVDQLELEITRQLRAILHHPDFQAMEAAWGGVALLVNAFGSDENIKLSLIDVSKTELMADLQAAEIETSGCYQSLAQQSCAMVVADYTFGDTVAELETLERLSRIAAAINAPLIAAAHPHLAGCESFQEQPDQQPWTRKLIPQIQERWQTLRESAAAGYLGLAAPRFLLRPPYGQGGDAIELFPFEELPDHAPHEFYLWGNPAFLCGYVVCQAFVEEGWRLSMARSGEVDEMPVYEYEDDGERKVKSWTEAWLTERNSSWMLKQGLIAAVAMKHRNAVHLASLQSIALPAAPLRWCGQRR